MVRLQLEAEKNAALVIAKDLQRRLEAAHVATKDAQDAAESFKGQVEGLTIRLAKTEESLIASIARVLELEGDAREFGVALDSAESELARLRGVADSSRAVRLLRRGTRFLAAVAEAARKS